VSAEHLVGWFPTNVQGESIEVYALEGGGWRAIMYRDDVPCGASNGSENVGIHELARRRLAPESLRAFRTRAAEAA
jgi:hypothetical protein